MSSQITSIPVVDQEISVANILGNPYNVLLFNDEVHTMEEVVGRIISATNCTMDMAVAIMYEAHAKGHAVVFTGSKERCELVDSILAGTRAPHLITDIQPA